MYVKKKSMYQECGYLTLQVCYSKSYTTKFKTGNGFSPRDFEYFQNKLSQLIFCQLCPKGSATTGLKQYQLSYRIQAKKQINKAYSFSHRSISSNGVILTQYFYIDTVWSQQAHICDILLVIIKMPIINFFFRTLYKVSFVIDLSAIRTKKNNLRDLLYI